MDDARELYCAEVVRNLLTDPATMTPLVTIGIPCYNAAASIKIAIESALAQTHPNIEVIVVDDGSTDTSLVIASAFDERVNVIRTSHRGSNHARNRILRESRAEWIQFLDADDRLEPEKIARQLAEAGDYDEVDVIYSPVIVETTIGGKSWREISRTSPKRDLYAQWLAGELPQTGGCLWRRTALQDIDGWRVEQPCYQEHELYCRSLKEGHRWKFAPTPGAVYRIWSENTLCRKDPPRVIRVRTRLMDHLREWMQARKLWKPVHAQIAGRACLAMARTLARYNLADASRYHRDRRKHDMIHLEGLAVPHGYRWTYRFLGFANSERLASLLQ